LAVVSHDVLPFESRLLLGLFEKLLDILTRLDWEILRTLFRIVGGSGGTRTILGIRVVNIAGKLSPWVCVVNVRRHLILGIGVVHITGTGQVSILWISVEDVSRDIPLVVAVLVGLIRQVPPTGRLRTGAAKDRLRPHRIVGAAGAHPLVSLAAVHVSHAGIVLHAALQRIRRQKRSGAADGET
jgi:hypothetical protein